MKSIFSLFLVLLSVSSAQASLSNLDGRLKSIDAAEKVCLETAMSTFDMNVCSDATLKSADSLLNEIYKDITGTLRADAQSQKNLPEFDQTAQETLSRLVTAQKAWITFRDADCNLSAAQMINGSGEGQILGSCLASMTMKRVKQLGIQFQ